MTDQMLLQHQPTGMAANVAGQSGGHYTIMSNLQATLGLATLIFATFGAIFATPPMSASADFYRHHWHKKKEGFLGLWQRQPPRAALLHAWSIVINVCLMLSTVWYIYNEAMLTAGNDDATNYFLAVLSLLLLIIVFRYFWKGLVWNHYYRTWAMITAGVMAVIVVLAEFVLIVLMGIRNVWFSMAFMMVIFLVSWPLPVWTWVLYYFFKEKPKSKRKREHDD